MRRAVLGAAFVLALVVPASADDVLAPGAAFLDQPTILSLGVQLLIDGDDDHDAEVGVRYRAVGDLEWRAAMPLVRVRPEYVTGRTVPEHFAGSLFDLTPATTYDIELRAIDADGPVDETIALQGTTRAVPADPVAPVPVVVSSAATLSAALASAQPGHVITLADGTYTGAFALYANGSAANPIVIRGTSTSGTVLDGNGCGSCNVLEVYGSHVHVERLTLQHANRGLRFQGVAAERNVVRRVHVRDVRLGIGTRTDQRGFYLCDNVLEGRLAWPHVYRDDGGARADDDGIRLEGTGGHVVCHNRISGFGDAIKLAQDGTRAVDVYGNEILSAYDNGFEFDGSEGNVRAFRNRFTNTYATLSFQPVFGGPVYALRNVVVNVADEQLKLKALGVVPPQEPSGILVLNNTFVSPAIALNLQTPATTRNLLMANNLFVGPSPAGPRVVDWTAPLADFSIDYDGWFPAGRFDWNALGDWPSFAAMVAAGVLEAHGTLLAEPIFAHGLAAPATYEVTLPGQDASLAAASNAVDAGAVFPNVTDGFSGAAPDLGALERDCPVPLYGVRPDGIDETNAPIGCGGPTVTTVTTTPTTTTSSTTLPFVPIGTKSLSLRDDPSASKRQITFKASTRRDPAPNRVVPPARGSAGDPTLHGALLEVADTAGSGQHVIVPLPANDLLVGSWDALGSTAKPAGYRFRGARGGPLKSIVVKADAITVKGGGSAWPFTLASAPQGSVAVRLTLGTDRPWCAEAPAKTSGLLDTVARFVAEARSPAPEGCPPE